MSTDREDILSALGVTDLLSALKEIGRLQDNNEHCLTTHVFADRRNNKRTENRRHALLQAAATIYATDRTFNDSVKGATELLAAIEKQEREA